MMSADTQTLIDRARWWVLQHHPFYGALAMRLRDVMDESIATACTDGVTIRWSPAFVRALSAPELRFVLLHEVAHCAHQHIWRLPPTPAGNVAGDYAINLLLVGIPGIAMPKDALLDKQYQGMAEEEILAALPRDHESCGGCGDFSAPAQPRSGESQADALKRASALRDDWERAVIQAAQAAKLSQGTQPAGIERILDRVAAQPLDWRNETAAFVRCATAQRNDWSRPARRHAWQSVIYPRRYRDALGLVVFARDTSGSVDDVTLGLYSTLIDQCVADTGCTALVIDCDAAIHAEYRVEPGESCPRHAAGGGGTDFRPVFERVETLIADGENIAGVVYLTDMKGKYPAHEPSFATLWVATTKTSAPWGRTVNL